jgi:hypothetical protein
MPYFKSAFVCPELLAFFLPTTQPFLSLSLSLSVEKITRQAFFTSGWHLALT